jgi:peptide deformylase
MSMKLACAAHEGVGIAAPQVGIGKRVFVAHLSIGSIVAVNPVLHLSGPVSAGVEGCLSLPGEQHLVGRHQLVRLDATDEHGAPFSLAARGWDARILQHEADHLDGILICDRARPTRPC